MKKLKKFLLVGLVMIFSASASNLCVMAKAESNAYLEELSQKLNIKITPVDNDGYSLVETILGGKY